MLSTPAQHMEMPMRRGRIPRAREMDILVGPPDPELPQEPVDHARYPIDLLGVLIEEEGQNLRQGELHLAEVPNIERSLVADLLDCKCAQEVKGISGLYSGPLRCAVSAPPAIAGIDRIEFEPPPRGEELHALPVTAASLMILKGTTRDQRPDRIRELRKAPVSSRALLGAPIEGRLRGVSRILFEGRLRGVPRGRFEGRLRSAASVIYIPYGEGGLTTA